MKRVLIFLLVAVFLVACGNTNEFKNTIADQEEEIEDLKQELDKSEGYASILEASLEEEEELSDDEEKSKEEIKITAGTHYFGEDIEPGRYIMKPDEGTKGNVRILTEDDDLKDAVALGDGSGYSEKEYTFNADYGDEIETATTIILYPKD